MANKITQVNIKMGLEEKGIIEEKSKALGLGVSEYMRFMAINGEVKITVKRKD